MLEKIKQQLTQNLAFLNQRYPDLYNYIIEQKIWERPILFHESDQGIVFHYYDEKLYDLESNAKTRVELFEEHLQVIYFDPYAEVTVSLQNYIQSYINNLSPKARAKTFSQSIEEMIIFGLLPFFHLKPLMEKLTNKKQFKRLQRITIVEHNMELFYAFLMVCDLQNLLQMVKDRKIDIKLLIPKSDNEVVKVFHELFQQAGEVDTKIFGFYNSYNSQKHDFYFEKAKELLYMNYIMIPQKFYQNALENIPSNIKIKQLCKSHPKPIDLPALILGSGPSLAKNIEWVKEHQERFYLVSLTSTFKILAQNDIIPDAVVVVDTGVGIGEGKNEIFKGHLDKLQRTTALGTLEIDPKIFENSYRSYVFGSEFLPSILQKCESFNKSPTVFVHALELILKMGFQKIYALGVDLGTTKKEEFYSPGYGEGFKHNYLPQTYEGNFGDQVFTKVDYLTTKTVAEVVVEIAKSQRPDVEFYNLSEGLKIKGFEPIRAKDVQLDHRSRNKEPLFAYIESSFELFPHVQTIPEAIHYLLRINDELMSSIKSLKKSLQKEHIDSKRFFKTIKKIVELKGEYRTKTGGVLFKAHPYFLYLTYILTLQKVFGESVVADYLQSHKDENFTQIDTLLDLLTLEKETLSKLL